MTTNIRVASDRVKGKINTYMFHCFSISGWLLGSAFCDKFVQLVTQTTCRNTSDSLLYQSYWLVICSHQAGCLLLARQLVKNRSPVGQVRSRLHWALWKPSFVTSDPLQAILVHWPCYRGEGGRVVICAHKMKGKVGGRWTPGSESPGSRRSDAWYKKLLTGMAWLVEAATAS